MIMGNTAETILNHMECSVLALKPSSFVSAIQMERLIKKQLAKPRPNGPQSFI